MAVATTIPGNVWKYVPAVGDAVRMGDTIAIIESMKMEMAVTAPASGRLREIRAEPGRTVRAGDTLAVIEH